MLGNKQLQAALDEAKQKVTGLEASMKEHEASAAEATSTIESLKASLASEKATNVELSSKVESLEASVKDSKLATDKIQKELDDHKALFDDTVAKEVENRLAAAAPDLDLNQAKDKEENATDFEAAYTESRAKGGAAHAKFLNENREQIREYLSNQS